MSAFGRALAVALAALALSACTPAHRDMGVWDDGPCQCMDWDKPADQ